MIQGAAQKFWVAWIGTLSATLLLTTDAEATWGVNRAPADACISSVANVWPTLAGTLARPDETEAASLGFHRE